MRFAAPGVRARLHRASLLPRRRAPSAARSVGTPEQIAWVRSAATQLRRRPSSPATGEAPARILNAPLRAQRRTAAPAPSAGTRGSAAPAAAARQRGRRCAPGARDRLRGRDRPRQPRLAARSRRRSSTGPTTSCGPKTAGCSRADAPRAGAGGALGWRACPAPLLIADVPWLLYRSYFALPKSITGAGGRPVNALLGTVNALLCRSRRSPRTAAPSGPSWPAWAPRRPPTASRSTRPTTPTASRCPRSCAEQWAARARAAREPRLDVCHQRGARGRRRDVLLRPRRGGRAAARRCC